MAFRYQRNARRRAEVAAVAGVCLVIVAGPLAAVPAVAFVALTYYAHQVAAVLAGDDGVPYPSLALVIVLNASVVLLAQGLVLFEGFTRST
jgi:hypothetical protein